MMINKGELIRRIEALSQTLTQPTHDDDWLEEETFENPFHGHVARRGYDEHECEDRRWDGGFKIEILEHSGSIQVEEFLDWLGSIEKIFCLKDVQENNKVKLVGLRLKCRALAWWDQLNLVWEQRGKPKVADSKKMKKMRQFLSFNYVQICQHLLWLQQGNRTLSDSIGEFQELIPRSGLSESEEQLVAHYICGLWQSIQDVLNLHNIWTVS